MGYREEVLADNPRGYWRLGETSGTVANDDTANNLDGTYVSSPTLGVTGAVSGNTAATFVSASSKVTVPDNNLLDFGDVFTLEAWVKHEGSTINTTIFNKGSVSFLFYFESNNTIKLRKSGTGDIVTSTVPISDTTQ